MTGWRRRADGETLGFQVTFFRTRPDAVDVANPSAFTPRQIVIGHAAISDPARGRLWKAQRVARAGFGLAEARKATPRRASTAGPSCERRRLRDPRRHRRVRLRADVSIAPSRRC